MNIYESAKYNEDVEYIVSLPLQWDKMQDSIVLVSGASGMIGSMVIDVIMRLNQVGLNCKVFALGRNEDLFKNRFRRYVGCSNLEFVNHDVKNELKICEGEQVDYVLGLASNTHPIQYSTNPIETILTNVIGNNNLLDFSFNHKARRFLLASSNEIYGENRGDCDLFDEKYCGYIDCNTVRAGYPESKRVAESLCQSYINQKNLDVVIARITRTYGPTVLQDDSKALSQFLFNAISGNDIILKSPGNQYYSYMYVSDTVSGIFYILLNGKKGEAYNISDLKSDIELKNLAALISKISNVKVVHDIPGDVEKKGFSVVTKARLDSSKLYSLGWKPKYCIEEGIERTIDILSKGNI